MSAIDRAFIKAYGEESAPAPGDAPPAAPGPKGGPHMADAWLSPSPEVGTNSIPRARKARRRLTTPRSTEMPPNAPVAKTEADAASHHGDSITTAPVSLGGSKPKMVVGRRALQRLAESAGVPAPHAAFSQSPTTSIRSEDTAHEPSSIATGGGRPPRIADCGTQYDLTANTRQAGNAPPSESHAASSHYRVDPTVLTSRQRYETVEPRDQRRQVVPPSTAAPLEIAGVRPLSVCLTPPQAPPAFAALEVDRFSWSPACDVLLRTAHADLEAAATLMTSQRENDGQVIALASSELSEGCTTIVQCLARMLASAGKRVCLVDADFEFPQLAETMGLSPDRGLESLLAGEAALGDVLIESLEDQVTLLPLTRPIGSDLVERSKLRQTVLLGELRDHFDMILIDAGRACTPHKPACSILQAGAGIDAVILVRAQDTTRSAWRQARQSIERWSLNCLGVIENRCELSRGVQA